MSGNYAELINDRPLKLLETHTYLNAEYYDWSQSQAYGGSWNDKASDCKINSHEITQGASSNKIDGGKYAFRLVYSHDIHALSDN